MGFFAPGACPPAPPHCACTVHTHGPHNNRNTAPGSDLAVLLGQPVHSSLRFSLPPFNCIPIPETSISLSPRGRTTVSEWGEGSGGRQGRRLCRHVSRGALLCLYDVPAMIQAVTRHSYGQHMAESGFEPWQAAFRPALLHPLHLSEGLVSICEPCIVSATKTAFLECTCFKILFPVTVFRLTTWELQCLF